MNKNILLVAIPAILAILSHGAINRAQTNVSIAHVPEEVVNAYSMWKLKHGKLYATPEEHNYRLLNFYDSWNLVKEHNANKKNTYTLGMNLFSDMSFEEFTAKYANAQPPTEEEELSLEVGTTSLKAPSSWDWTSNTGVTTYVKNQGSCGSCWAFSAAATAEMEYNRVFGQKGYSLSPQKILDCSGGGSCRGGNSGRVFSNTQMGHATWNSWPYKGAQQSCNQSKKSSGPKSRGMKRVAKDFNSWKNMIAKRAISIYHSVSPSFKQYKSGNFNDRSCGNYNSWHVVTAVGYGSNFIKLKNSWSERWGDKGYFKFQISGGLGICNHMKYSAEYMYFRTQDA